MNEESPENKRARFDAEFDEESEKSPFVGPAQLLTVRVDEAIDGDRNQLIAAIESLANALDHGESDNVKAWVRQHLRRYVTRAGENGEALVGQIRYEMFDYYVNIADSAGVAATAGGNENLVALLARVKES